MRSIDRLLHLYTAFVETNGPHTSDGNQVYLGKQTLTPTLPSTTDPPKLGFHTLSHHVSAAAKNHTMRRLPKRAHLSSSQRDTTPVEERERRDARKIERFSIFFRQHRASDLEDQRSRGQQDTSRIFCKVQMAFRSRARTMQSRNLNLTRFARVCINYLSQTN